MSWLRRSPERRRVKALGSAPAGPLRDYLSHPFQEASTPLEGVRLLALDIETTGLDPTTDHLLSVGFVPVDGRCVVLAGARQLVVAAETEVGASATVHGLTDDVVAQGAPIATVVAEVLEALAGRVLLAHFSRIEVDFLTGVCRRLYGGELACQVVDTLELQDKVVRTPFVTEPLTGQLRLWAARERFGLPRYRAHEALTDALACAELYLAQVAELDAVTLRDVVL